MVDWNLATHEERSFLNTPVNTLRRRRGLSWHQVFEEAFGARDHVGDRYEDNVRKGRIAPERAWKLLEWLKAGDASLAEDVEQAVRDSQAGGSPSHSDAWQALLRLPATAAVRVIKLNGALGALQFARRRPVSPAILALNDEFYFEIDTPITGYVAAFHGRGGRWSLVGLTEKSPVTRVIAGAAILPVDADGQPFPLVEDVELGHHAFLFAIVDVPKRSLLAPLPPYGMHIPPAMLNRLAEPIAAVEESKRVIARVDITFTG